MRIFASPREINREVQAIKKSGRDIGLVPTLGYLHDGHAALIRRAKKENDTVIVSRFLNPLQFRKKAYRAYPTDEKRDRNFCRDLSVDYLFSPSAGQMYPPGFDTLVEVRDLAGRLEGQSIRWHYRAVTTVVAKLFNIIQPSRAYFGKKDAHQLAIIKRMTEDLNFPVKIIAVATRRASDGVALSSRNSLLSEPERIAARMIPQAVKAIESRVKKGDRDRAKLKASLVAMIESEPLAKVDFAAVVDSDTLLEDRFGDRTLIYAAVYIGGKRLTDNVVCKSG